MAAVRRMLDLADDAARSGARWMAESDFSDPQVGRGGIALYDAPRPAPAPAFARGEPRAISMSAERDAAEPAAPAPALGESGGRRSTEHPDETAAEPEQDMCANCRFYRYRMIDPQALRRAQAAGATIPEGQCRAHPVYVDRKLGDWCGEHQRREPTRR